MSVYSGSIKKDTRLTKTPGQLSTTSQWSNVTGRSFVVRFVGQQARKSIMFQDKGVRDALLKREHTKIYLGEEDVSPKNLGKIDLEDLLDDFEIPPAFTSMWSTGDRNRRSFIGNQGVSRSSSLACHMDVCRSNTADMDSIVNQMDKCNVENSDETLLGSITTMAAATSIGSQDKGESISEPPLPQYIKIIVRETGDIDLFETKSVTVPKGSEEARIVEADNDAYDYLSIGKGKARRTSEAEAQTSNILYKSRSVNTDRVRTQNVASYVSNFEMYDTFAELERTTQTLDEDNGNQIALTTYSVSGAHDDPDELLGKNENFKLSAMVLQRLLAGNNFRERQKRFRNMTTPDPLDLSIKYLYRVRELWTYQLIGVVDTAISSLSWCHSNSDLLAVGYGVYDYVDAYHRVAGYVCVWSIKNPRNPERIYKYNVPITAVAFSRETPQLLAIGTYAGTIEVLDITDDDATTRVGRSQRSTSPSFEPVWKIEWILVGPEEELLSISEDGLVMRYSLTKGPYLLGFRQIKLDRVEGAVEGLSVPAKPDILESYRSPQAITLQIHPLKSDIFFVGTEEGCLHRCSTYYPHQYSGIQQVHRGSVHSMEFSPFSPKIFLTCGSDWKTRIWIEDIFEPVIELCNGFEAIRSAFWSPNHSTVIVCITKKQIELWNIRKNVQKPASITQFYSANIPLTTCRFSPCGRSLVVGDMEGTVHVCALDDMPFPPHFQYHELQSAIYQALQMKKELLSQVKSLGNLGYAKNEQKRTG